MAWIVLGEKNGRVSLVSKSNISGILPKGSYLTVEDPDNNCKFILRVDDSNQHEPYKPNPLIVDMDLSPLIHDQKCFNIIEAVRVKDISDRADGLIDYIRPQLVARRSNQDEINLALGDIKKGPVVFLGTVHSTQNQLLIDENNDFITSFLPDDMFFHQIMICGKTGSGKTVAMKYFSQYFTEEYEGAVLAINVKESDFLKMYEPSITNNEKIKNEWKMLGLRSQSMDNFMVYYPSNSDIRVTKGINPDYCKSITLDVKTIDPDSLVGLLQNISDIGAQNLPDIFRYWQQIKIDSRNNFTFNDFVEYFYNGINDSCEFSAMNIRGDKLSVHLHRGTFDSIHRSLAASTIFFDSNNSITLNEDDILQPGKMSVIDVAVDKGAQFGSILLRHLLHRISLSKANHKSTVPILIIIDEVHQFYDTKASNEALGDLDTICRTGRSQKMGVIFASQNPEDMPGGISSVVNSKIFFKTDASLAKHHGINISQIEMENLKKGYAAVSIHEVPQLKIIKFPLSCAGVFE